MQELIDIVKKHVDYPFEVSGFGKGPGFYNRILMPVKLEDRSKWYKLAQLQGAVERVSLKENQAVLDVMVKAGNCTGNSYAIHFEKKKWGWSMQKQEQYQNV